MYRTSKEVKWHTGSASILRRKASMRRNVTMMILLACFVIWRAQRSTQLEQTPEQDWMTMVPPTYIVLRPPERLHARDLSKTRSKTEDQRPVGLESHSSPEQEEIRQSSPMRDGIPPMELKGKEDYESPDHETYSSLEPEETEQSLLDRDDRPHVESEPDDIIRNHPPELRQSVVESTSESAQNLVNGHNQKVSENVTPDEADDGEETALKGIAVAAQGKEPPSAAALLSDKPQQLLGQSEERSNGKVSVDTMAYDKDFFPPHSQFEALDAMADTLPDVVHIPFEEATSDVTLQGWEDEWFSDGVFDNARWGTLQEPKIDFIYTWVNGSEKAFQDTIAPYELNSTLNEPDGQWLQHHRTNRYRDWDELRYSIRTVERYAKSFRNKLQILVNAVGPEGTAAAATPSKPSKIVGKQVPSWMDFTKRETVDNIQIVAQEEFFGEEELGCLPTFNSLTIENQIYNTKSDTDRFFAMSDDMFLGRQHAASDLYSPMFGPTMGFKTNAYNTREPPTDLDARRFGEKPYLIYTSWLLNRRFGERKRKGQVHFGHSMSRSVTREAINSFPRPALQSSCQRFRGETGFQLYSWYVTFHYTMERQREALLWSYIMQRSDTNQDGNIDWSERQNIMEELEEGMENQSKATFRTRMWYQVPELLEAAGLEAPKVNQDILWTTLDGPSTIRDIECLEFNVNECIAPGFSVPSNDDHFTNPVFSAASIFDRLARQHPKCGDCLIKLILHRQSQGLAPLLPHADTQVQARATVVKALLKYQYTIVEPDVLFVMVTDAQQVKNVLLRRLVNQNKEVGQLCLNDDVATDDEAEILSLRKTLKKFFKAFAPGRSVYERGGS